MASTLALHSSALTRAAAHNPIKSLEPDMKTHHLSPEHLEALGRMSLSADDLFGPCDDELEVRLPSELKDLLRREAAKRRMTLAAYVRISLATAALGPDHVTMLVLQRVGVAQQQAPVDVPTNAG
jgi:serine/threonine protein phosphatase PrpC